MAKRALIICCLVWLILLVGSPVSYAQQGGEDPVVRTRTNLVTVTVSVTDPLGRNIVNLTKDDFEVYDDNVLQTIEYFTDGEVPISVGIIFDISGSMKGFPALSAVEAFTKFLDFCRPDDEFFLVGFNDKAVLVRDWTPVSNRFTDHPMLLETKGSTAVYDAVYLALSKISTARHKRRALLILSDGQDNNSRYSFKEVRKLAKETDAQIYAIGGIGYGYTVLGDLTELTGGRGFFAAAYEDAITALNNELRKQYSIGFTPAESKGPRRYHKLKVKLKKRGAFLQHARVRAREGYFSEGELGKD